MNRGQHVGDLIVIQRHERSGQVAGAVVVKTGGVLICRGQITGGLIVETGGRAIIHGQVCRNVVNQGGHLEIYGQVCGRVIGPVHNALGPNQVIGDDLEVRFGQPTKAWSVTIED